MPVHHCELELPFPVESLWQYHARDGGFDRLLPPWQPLQRLEKAPMQNGAREVFRVKQMGIWWTWEAVLDDVQPGRGFSDEQKKGPFAHWVHSHRFEPTPTGSRLVDHIEYRMPMGFLGSVGAPKVAGDLRRLFAFRHRRTASDLARHARFADQARRTVGLTGATGLVGSALRPLLTTGGHTVKPFVRRGSDGIRWDPEKGEVDAAGLEGLDAVVNLAGEPIGTNWTEEHKKRIRDSRVEGTAALCKALAAMKTKPSVLVSASAVGYYGDRGEEDLSEESLPGQDFLAGVCKDWEAATQPARDAGIRVVNLRVGIAISGKGGMLPELMKPFLFGAGGPAGTGRQYVSWIALDDLVGVIHEALMDARYVGPLNGTAPEPVRNGELATALGRAMTRPACLPAPAFAIRGLLGEAGETLVLGGQRVRPKVAMANGYVYGATGIDEALKWELGAF